MSGSISKAPGFAGGCLLALFAAGAAITHLLTPKTVIDAFPGAGKLAGAAGKLRRVAKPLAKEAEKIVVKPPAKTVRVKKAKLKPGTPEHKADRWKKYQERGGKWDYDRWSKQYDTNMENYQRGLDREAEYRDVMGGESGTLETPYGDRQVDILKEDDMYAGQLKTGPVSLTKENVLAIQKDGWLVSEGWTVEHILE